MKTNFLSFLFFLLIVTYANGKERSEKEIKLGVFLSDLEQIGDFKKINYSPIGMFPDTAIDFHKKQVISQKKFVKTFVSKWPILASQVSFNIDCTLQEVVSVN